MKRLSQDAMPVVKYRRGVFERPVGSGIFWIRYQDENGRERREKVGPLRGAEQLVEKRRTEVRLKVKLPENFRSRPVSFDDIAKTTLEYSEANKPRSYRDDKCRMPKIQEKFGNWLAEKITPQDIEAWLASRTEWSEATKNRYLSLMKLTYRLAELNGKVRTNPARLVRMRKENNARVRYLNQFKPLDATEVYLKPHKTEEARLRAVIEKDYPQHLAELEIALNTGLRRSEQYGLQWKDVNFERKMLTIPRAKNGETRHVPLNAPALVAFRKLLPGMEKNNHVFVSERREKALRNSRHWFEDAVERAGVRDFTWHCLRHTFASRLIMAGVDIRTAQELMGHKTIVMTMRYAHLAPAHLHSAVEKLAGYNSRGKRARRRTKAKSGTATGTKTAHSS